MSESLFRRAGNALLRVGEVGASGVASWGIWNLPAAGWKPAEFFTNLGKAGPHIVDTPNEVVDKPDVLTKLINAAHSTANKISTGDLEKQGVLHQDHHWALQFLHPESANDLLHTSITAAALALVLVWGVNAFTRIGGGNGAKK